MTLLSEVDDAMLLAAQRFVDLCADWLFLSKTSLVYGLSVLILLGGIMEHIVWFIVLPVVISLGVHQTQSSVKREVLHDRPIVYARIIVLSMSCLSCMIHNYAYAPLAVLWYVAASPDDTDELGKRLRETLSELRDSFGRNLLEVRKEIL